MSQNQVPEKRITRSAAKLNIIFQKEIPLIPPHRSTEIYEGQPIDRRITEPPSNSSSEEDEANISKNTEVGEACGFAKGIAHQKESNTERDNSLEDTLERTLSRLRHLPDTFLDHNRVNIQNRTGLAAIRNLLDSDQNGEIPTVRSTTGTIPRQKKSTKKAPHQEEIPPNYQQANRSNMATITLNQSLNMHRAAATPKFLSPTIFDPCTNNANNFIAQYERTAAVNGWDSALKMAYFQSFLEGAANHWFERYKNNRNTIHNSWDDVKTDFLQEYGHGEQRRELERKLYQARQGATESVKSYYYNLQNMFGEFDPTNDIEEFRKFFENGLRTELYTNYKLLLEDHMNWGKFNKLINKLEDISNYNKDREQCNNQPLINTTCQNCHCTRYNYQGPLGRYKQMHNPPQFQVNNRTNPPIQHVQQRHNTNNYNLNNPSSSRNLDFNWRISRNTRTNNNPNQKRNQEQVLQQRNLRTHDGRIRCYRCNRIGHHGSNCMAREVNPNEKGRR